MKVKIKELVYASFLYVCLITGGTERSAASFTVEADGSVAFGTPEHPVTLSLNGRSIRGEDVVPLGTIIDWWAPSTSFNFPKNYWPCDGTLINDEESPYNGFASPNLNNCFVLGTSSAMWIGQRGGSSAFNLSVSTTADGLHSHTISQGTGLISKSGPSPDVGGCYWMYNGSRKLSCYELERTSYKEIQVSDNISYNESYRR